MVSAVALAAVEYPKVVLPLLVFVVVIFAHVLERHLVGAHCFRQCMEFAVGTIAAEGRVIAEMSFASTHLPYVLPPALQEQNWLPRAELGCGMLA